MTEPNWIDDLRDLTENCDRLGGEEVVQQLQEIERKRLQQEKARMRISLDGWLFLLLLLPGLAIALLLFFFVDLPHSR